MIFAAKRSARKSAERKPQNKPPFSNGLAEAGNILFRQTDYVFKTGVGINLQIQTGKKYKKPATAAAATSMYAMSSIVAMTKAVDPIIGGNNTCP